MNNVYSLLGADFWIILLKSSFFSVGRLLATYLICLFISLAIAIWLASSRKAERIAVPIFDLAQNVPALAFYPIVAMLFIGMGISEGAAIFVLTMGMLWPLLFGLIGATHNISQEVRDVAGIFGAKRWKYVYYVFFPIVFPAAVSSSMASWSMGWNLLVVAEWLRYKKSYL